MWKDTITSPSNLNASTTVSTASFTVNSSSSPTRQKETKKKRIWYLINQWALSLYKLWWNRPNTCDIKHRWSTWQNDGLHLVVLPQNPQKQTSQIQRIDELPQSTTWTPDLQRFTFLYNTNMHHLPCEHVRCSECDCELNVSHSSPGTSCGSTPASRDRPQCCSCHGVQTCWWGWRLCISNRTADITP